MAKKTKIRIGKNKGGRRTDHLKRIMKGINEVAAKGSKMVEKVELENKSGNMQGSVTLKPGRGTRVYVGVTKSKSEHGNSSRKRGNGRRPTSHDRSHSRSV